MRTEDQEQMLIFQWAAFAHGKHPELDLLYHIPNGGKRSKAEAGRFKAMGVKSGVPDLMLPVQKNGYHGLYIELKREKGGTVSPEQQKWINALRKQGYAVEVCKGFEQARCLLVEYLNGKYKHEDEKQT